MTGVYAIQLFLLTCLATMILSEVEYDGPNVVRQNDTFNITCKLSKEYRLKWTKDYETVLLSSEKFDMIETPSSDMSQLTVYNACKGDSGLYRCTSHSKWHHSIVVSPDVMYKGPNFVKEYETFNITCKLSMAYRLKWMKDNETILPSTAKYDVVERGPSGLSQLTVYNASKNDSGAYRCTEFVEQMNHTVVVLPALERDFNETQTIDLSIGKDHTFTCKAVSEGVKAKWYKNEIPILNDKQYQIVDRNLTILSPDDDDAGTYVCGSEIDMINNQTFIARTRARVEMLPVSINLVEDDTLNLTCVTKGNPKPSVTWRKDGTDVKELNISRIKLEKSADNVPDATLLISKLEDSDRALYTCFIESDVNSAKTSTLVRVKDKLAALWPFLGIVAEVAILCTIILIYEKRRAKQEYDESDTDQNNESKPVADQKEKDVRQRK